MLVTVALTMPAAAVPTAPQSMLTSDAALLRSGWCHGVDLEYTRCATMAPYLVHGQQHIATQHVLLGAADACARPAPERHRAPNPRHALEAAARCCPLEQHALARHGASVCSGTPTGMNLVQT